MPVAPLPVLDDRAERRLFCMLALLAADGPASRRALMQRVERLVPLLENERERAVDSADHTAAGRVLTRAYETLRKRGLLVHPPRGDVWELTSTGSEAVEAAAGSYREFWGRVEEVPAVDTSAAQSEEILARFEPAGPLNRILYGPPGTGKTYSTVDAALACLRDTASPVELGGPSPSRQDLLAAYRAHVNAGHIEFVTFHQAFSYEDFVEGFRPVVDEGTAETERAGGQIRYEVRAGVFKRLAERASVNPDQAFVLVIDEINRGNVAGIFGELITLVEDGKRIGQPEQLRVQLPYSGESFGVPVNLHIIGTMNTADRSLAGVDLALRRRFDFTEMPPQKELLEDVVAEDVKVADVMSHLNRRIQAAKGRDFAIGHAFFLPLAARAGGATLADLAEVFRRKVLPLLQEYFFEDDLQIARVLNQAEPHDKEWDYLHREVQGNGGRSLWSQQDAALEDLRFYHQIVDEPFNGVPGQRRSPVEVVSTRVATEDGAAELATASSQPA
ncbi:McrB family protein [Kineococcus sp. SYSU DK002]|uniref:McrB family protein n=1 Tax=Kineococcus sp. SYSU DK002 TaxID=3383123 RepID=UPI003D7F07F7